MLNTLSSNLKKNSRYCPCFICGVDSTELKVLVFGFIGFLALSTLLFMLGFYIKGHFRNSEAISDYPLKVEFLDQEGVDNE